MKWFNFVLLGEGEFWNTLSWELFNWLLTEQIYVVPRLDRGLPKSKLSKALNMIAAKMLNVAITGFVIAYIEVIWLSLAITDFYLIRVKPSC